MEAGPEGMQFVTARGWEDLSEILHTYEALGLTADREVVGQYLQMPAIAKDFANYLELYAKYRRVYRVEEILNGSWEALRARELAAAPFDEKLSVLGLVLSRLNESARAAWQLDQLAGLVHESLLRVKAALGQTPAAQILTAELTGLDRQIAAKKEAGSADRQGMQLLNQAARTLEGYLHTLELEAPAEPFDRLKELFAETLDQRAAAADETGSYLANAFAFLDESLPGSQELVIFATELTAGFYTSWYIETFGCEAYFAHNKDLLFADTENALLGEIAAARAAQNGTAGEALEL